MAMAPMRSSSRWLAVVAILAAMLSGDVATASVARLQNVDAGASRKLLQQGTLKPGLEPVGNTVPVLFSWVANPGIVLSAPANQNLFNSNRVVVEFYVNGGTPTSVWNVNQLGGVNTYWITGGASNFSNTMSLLGNTGTIVGGQPIDTTATNGFFGNFPFSKWVFTQDPCDKDMYFLSGSSGSGAVLQCISVIRILPGNDDLSNYRVQVSSRSLSYLATTI
eukprot:gene5126-34932_t